MIMDFKDFIYKLQLELESNPGRGMQVVRKVVRDFHKYFEGEARRSGSFKNEQTTDPDDEIPF